MPSALPTTCSSRALFKARQATSALFGSILQRGLTKEAHENGMTEANYFSRLWYACEHR